MLPLPNWTSGDQPDTVSHPCRLRLRAAAFLIYLNRGLTLPQRVLRRLAQESLLIYFVHVCILYGSIGTRKRQLIGSTLGPLPRWVVCLLLLSMMLLAWTWNWFKRAEPRRSYLLRFAVLVLAVTTLGLIPAALGIATPAGAPASHPSNRHRSG